jgi:hypothetical protein
MRSMRRRIAAVVMLILTGGIAAPATCTGWESSPSARMACCQRAQHDDCVEQSAADDCCAQEEQSHQIVSPIAQVAAAVVSPAGLAESPAYGDYFTGLQSASRGAGMLYSASSPPLPALSPPLRI